MTALRVLEGNVSVGSPMVVLWNYGHWCNMNCLHCYSRPEARAATADMTTEEAERVADQLVGAKVMHVHFGGGEPLGRADFLPIARRIAKAGAIVTLSTNGSLLTETVADALRDLPLETIAFSIHGSDARSHDRFNGYDGAWDRLVSAVQRMVRRGVRVKLVSTLTRPVAEHAEHLLRLGDQWGVFMVQFQTFKRFGNAELNFPALAMDPSEWIETYHRIRAAEVEVRQAGSRLKIDLGLDNDPALAERLGMPTVLRKCDCGVYSLTIKVNGDVSPCGLSDEVVGNIHQTPLLKIWRENPELLAIRSGEKSACSTR